MNHSYWLIVVFVAAIVCNTNSRPQDNNVKNIYPVYRPSKELDLTKLNRYDKKFINYNNYKSKMSRIKRDAVSYVRIDIPYNKTNINSTRDRSMTEETIQDLNLINKDTNLVTQFVQNSLDDLKSPSTILLKNVTTDNKTNIIIKDEKKGSDMDYIPIAILNKNSSIKKWPSSQNGIESLDDLMLYNTYTNNVHSQNPSSQSGYIKRPINHNPANNLQTFPYLTHSKPAIIIIEELTTKRPYYDYSKPETIYSQPIHTHNRPTNPTYKPYVETETYKPQYETYKPHYETQTYKPYVETVTYKPHYETQTYKPYIETITYKPYIETVTYAPPPTYHVPTKPTYFGTITFSPTTETPGPLFTQNDYYTTVVPNVPTSTTKKPKKSKKPNCPNVSVTATSSIINNNNINKNKEGCNDINININSNLDNSNNVSLSEPVINGVYNDPITTTTQRPLFPFFNRPTIFNRPKPPSAQNIQSAANAFVGLIGAIFTRLAQYSFWNPLTLPFWSTVFAPLTVILAGGIGLAALMFPWAFPYFWFGRNRGRNRFIILRSRLDKPQKYIYRSIDKNTHYLKRTARDVRGSAYRGQINLKNRRVKGSMDVNLHDFCLTYCVKNNFSTNIQRHFNCDVCSDYENYLKKDNVIQNPALTNNLLSNWWWIKDLT